MNKNTGLEEVQDYSDYWGYSHGRGGPWESEVPHPTCGKEINT